MSVTWEKLVELYGMLPHPEGGFYKETYRGEGLIPAQALAKQGHHGDRAHSTAIYYLLPPGTKSMLHRMCSDEVFHFYLGGPMTLVKLGPKGEVETARLGQDVEKGMVLQHVVRAGWWFGGYCEGKTFSLVGCTVAPGFDFADFELGDGEKLAKDYPSAKALITRLMGPTSASSTPRKGRRPAP
jgi:predicted cupin superfamily sugar epimerase